GQGASAGRWPPLTFAVRAGRPVAERNEGMRRLFREQRDDDLGPDGGPDARGRHSSSSIFWAWFQRRVQTEGSSLDWNSLARIGNGKIGPSNRIETNSPAFSLESFHAGPASGPSPLSRRTR